MGKYCSLSREHEGVLGEGHTRTARFTISKLQQTDMRCSDKRANCNIIRHRRSTHKSEPKARRRRRQRILFS